jgi:hypothetical protein
MSPAELLTLVHDDLKVFVSTRGGVVSLAADPYNFLEQLAESPQGFKLVVQWAGDDNRTQSADEGVFADQLIEIGISVNTGLTLKPEAALIATRPGGAPALLALVEDVRFRIRSMVISRPLQQDCEPRFHYLGAKPVVLPDGVPLRAYSLRLSITAAPTPVGA